MTLDQIRIFVTVAELQHVTRAAEQLNLTQSTVSSAISTMETRHGVQLFHRIGRRIELTAEGSEFLKSARAILVQVRNAESMLEDLADMKRGSLTIFASQTIASFWLPSHLVAYLGRYPRVDLKVEIGNTSESVEAVSSGHAELGFIEGEINHAELQMHVVAEDRLVLAVGRRHPWASSKASLPSDLNQTKWALREVGSGTRSSFDNALAGYGLALDDLQVVLELPSNEAICSAVAATELATVLSESAVQAGVEAGRLVVIPLDLGKRAFRLIRHPKRHLSRAALTFLDMMPRS